MKRKYIFISASVILLFWLLYCFLPTIFFTEPVTGQIKLYDRNNLLIAHIPKEDGLSMPMGEGESLPSNLVDNLMLVEDKRFKKHLGIDFIAKTRALISNISAKQVVSGGSTLTEQWIKNRYFVDSRRTVIQKFREATLAVYFSLTKSKDDILRSYLNSAYFGHRIYGAKAASYVYFQKSDLNSLTDEEVATLITLLRSPSALTSDEAYFARQLARVSERMGIQMPTDQRHFDSFSSINLFPHVTASVLAELQEYDVPELIVQTTIDSELQRDAEKQLSYSLDRLAGNHVTNGAVYAFNPGTGEILVWQGSRDFYDDQIDGQVNIIEQKRQMGSALKPFIYLLAFLEGAHPDNLIVDLEKDFYENETKNEIFRPLNYSLHEGGVLTLKEALASSFNISAVRLLSHLGLDEGYDFLQTLGLKFDFPAKHYGLSLALGSPDLTMREVAEAYGVLATNGERYHSSLIESVNGVKAGRPLEMMMGKESFHQEAFYHLFNILSSQTNRQISFGLNSILNTSIPFAVKTGTTRNFKDNWTFGYHPDLVVAVWVGNNDGTPMQNVTGITGAAPIWHRVVEAAIQHGFVEDRSVLTPDSLKSYEKCLDHACTRKEVVYQNSDRKWLSDLIRGEFCLEDFYIQDIDVEEIQKIAKLFNFEAFSIDWCESERVLQLTAHSSQLKIIKPEDGERFYIKKSLPIELQKIIIKSTEPVVWLINGREYEKAEVVFLEPTESEYEIQIKGQPQVTKIFVEYVE